MPLSVTSLTMLVFTWPLPLGDARGPLMSVGVVLALVSGVVSLVGTMRDDPVLLGVSVAGLLTWIVCPPCTNPSDDFSGNLVFSSSFYSSLDASFHPLAERRLFTVGGQFALDAPVLHWLGTRWLSLVEPTLGVLLCLVAISLVPGAGRRSRRAAAVVVLLAPTAGFSLMGNTQAALTLTGLLAASLVLVQRQASGLIATMAAAPLVGLAWAAMASARPTLVVLTLGLGVVWTALARRRTSVVLGTLAGASFLAPSLPSYHRAYGTWYYPLLGRGRDMTGHGVTTTGVASAGDLLGAWVGSVTCLPSVCALVALLVLARRSASRAERLAWVSLVVALIAQAALLAVATDGLESRRYYYPVAIAFAVVAVAACGRESDALREAVPGWATAVQRVSVPVCGLVLAWLVVASWFPSGEIGTRLDRLESPSRTQAAAGLARFLNAHPGTVLFVQTNTEALVTPRLRHPFIVMDQPGMVLPPGDGGGYADRLSTYLVARSVRWIVLKDTGCDTAKVFRPGTGAWSDAIGDREAVNIGVLCTPVRQAQARRLAQYLVLPAGVR